MAAQHAPVQHWQQQECLPAAQACRGHDRACLPTQRVPRLACCGTVGFQASQRDCSRTYLLLPRALLLQKLLMLCCYFRLKVFLLVVIFILQKHGFMVGRQVLLARLCVPGSRDPAGIDPHLISM